MSDLTVVPPVIATFDPGNGVDSNDAGTFRVVENFQSVDAAVVDILGDSDDEHQELPGDLESAIDAVVGAQL